MPFLAPLGAVIGGAITGAVSWLGGGTILAGIVKMGLGLAAKYAIGLITGNRNKGQASSVQLETIYGESLARSIALGKVGTAGHRIYRNAWGEGNRNIQDVLVLSHFRITEVLRGRYKGEWSPYNGDDHVDLGQTLDAANGRIRSKFYLGLIDQTANADLVARSEGRWTTDHRGAGVAYAYNSMTLHREDLSQPWEPFWELKGAPLYDWRKDDTVGGDGDHRWDDQDTWEFSENPVLMMYLLERGVFVASQLICGKGVPAARLPLDRWTIAANICDEIVGGGSVLRYKAGLIAASGPGITHDQNMQPLLESCAGSWCEDATGEYPIVGALQSSVVTITDRDLATDQDIRYARLRTRTELVNTVSGKFQDPASFYEASPIAVRIDEDALAVDGETLAASIPFTAVNDLECADRLADIAFRASRYQANGDIVLRPGLMWLKPGDWLRWQSERYNFDKYFQVLTKRLGPFSPQGTRDVFLGLQEVGAGIFDPTEFQTVLPIPLPPNTPLYASEASGFVAGAISFESGGQIIPALQFQWSAFVDPTVIAVEIEYRKVGETDSLFKVATVPQQILRTADGVLSDTDMEYRHRLITSPQRTTFPTDWQTIHTDEASAPTVAITLDALQDDVTDLLREMNVAIAATRDRAEFVAGSTADALGSSVAEHTVARRFQTATAAVLSAQTAAIEEIDGVVTAIAESTELVLAQVGPVGAEGLFRIRAESTSSGAQATIGLSVSATENGVTQQAAILIDAMSGGESRIVLKGDKVLIADEDGVVQAMFDATGTYIRNALIQNLTADNIQAGSITGDEIAFNTLIGDHIVALSIDSPSLAFNSVTEFDQSYYFDDHTVGGGGSYNEGAWTHHLTNIVTNTAGTPMIEFVSLRAFVQKLGGAGSAEGYIVLALDGSATNVADGTDVQCRRRFAVDGNGTTVVSQTSFLPVGTVTRRHDIWTWNELTAAPGEGPNTFEVESTSGVLWWKR
jgi:hypothetical protein